MVTRPFLDREAVLSSKIEGTRTEVRQLYLFGAQDADDKTGEKDRQTTEELLDYQEVRNYLNALHYGLRQIRRRSITNGLLKEMHQLLMQHVRGQDKSPGEYRKNQAYIGSLDIQRARYVAPPAHHLEGCMDALEEHFSGSPSGNVPRLVTLAMIHYQFKAINPFADGNGRLGRLLITLMLAQLQILEEPLLYLSAYLEEHKGTYTDLLWEVSRDGCWEEWIGFFLEGVRSQATDAVQRARSLLQYRQECIDALCASGRVTEKGLLLVDRLFEHPAITVKGASELLGVTYQSANNWIERLSSREVDVLHEATGFSRNRVFVAHGIIERIQ